MPSIGGQIGKREVAASAWLGAAPGDRVLAHPVVDRGFFSPDEAFSTLPLPVLAFWITHKWPGSSAAEAARLGSADLGRI